MKVYYWSCQVKNHSLVRFLYTGMKKRAFPKQLLHIRGQRPYWLAPVQTLEHTCNRAYYLIKFIIIHRHWLRFICPLPRKDKQAKWCSGYHYTASFLAQLAALIFVFLPGMWYCFWFTVLVKKGNLRFHLALPRSESWCGNSASCQESLFQL